MLVLDDFSNPNNDTICCNNPSIGSNGTKFCGSLIVIGQEWVRDVNGLCSNLSANNMSCANASGSVLECVQNATWQWAVAHNNQPLYAFLQNHANGIQILVNYCEANQQAAFGGLQVADVKNHFDYAFGDLGNSTSAVAPPASGAPTEGASGSGIGR